MKDFLTRIKEKSPYYKKLWGNCELDLNKLPVIDQEEFWNANTWDNNQLLTGEISNGVVFKSGGTTGQPKFSVFTKNEWEDFTQIFGKSMSQVLEPGERVGNLFYSGELYASFLFIEKSLEHCPVPVVTFPISGATALSEIVKLVQTYKINVLAGVPTTFSCLAQHLIDHDIVLPLKKILYGGESLFDDQRALLNQAFSFPQISSIGYASVDAGHLGGSAPEMGARAHTVLVGTVMQLVDEDDNLITEANTVGRLLMTNTTRSLMPIIRYPVGDLAKWIVPGESFEILGRAQEGARVGPVTINRDDIALVLAKLSSTINFQLIIKRHDGKDLLVIRYVGKLNEVDALKLLLQERTMIKDCVEKNLICMPQLEKVPQLGLNARTGKLKSVIDERFI